MKAETFAESVIFYIEPRLAFLGRKFGTKYKYSELIYETLHQDNPFRQRTPFLHPGVVRIPAISN